MRMDGRTDGRHDEASSRFFEILRTCPNIYVQPTEHIYVFSMDPTTNNGYFLIQHKHTGFYNQSETYLLRGATESLKIIQIKFYQRVN